ncbi:MAG: DegV family protein [Epulopiscium sp.]|nr:DegV family protein [Candidatus Epulonipiscium sp.]
MAVQVLTDSTSYIDKSIREELGINIISLNVIKNGKSMREVDIDNKDFYKDLNEQEIPTSSQPSLDEVYGTMKKIIENGDDLVCIFLSSKMSGAYESAHIAKDMILRDHPEANIEIIDSKSNSMQLGYAAIVAARLAQEGKALPEVTQAVTTNIKRSRFLFLPDNLEYLIKGGRIAGAGALIGNLLKIIPILTVEEGETDIFKKARTKTKAISVMIDKLVKDALEYGIEEVCVHHINALEEAKQLVVKIKEKLKITATIADIGPIIGLHVGPGAIGVVYYTKEDMR